MWSFERGIKYDNKLMRCIIIVWVSPLHILNNIITFCAIPSHCKKLISMFCLGFKFQGMYLPSEILPELRGASALFILKATDI
jgi:hypothetical protein